MQSSIWNDAWLPSLAHPKILSPMVVDYSDSSVKFLIFPSFNSWNLVLLNKLFSTQEVDMIKRIPLRRSLMQDKLVWPHVLSGDYSVKSRHNFLSKKRAVASEVLSNSDQYQDVWKQIWGCKVPIKV